MIRLPITRAKAGLSAWARGVARGGEIVVLTRRGQDVAALVPVSMIHMAEQLGGALPDVAEAAKGLGDVGTVAGELTDLQEAADGRES